MEKTDSVQAVMQPEPATKLDAKVEPTPVDEDVTSEGSVGATTSSEAEAPVEAIVEAMEAPLAEAAVEKAVEKEATAEAPVEEAIDEAIEAPPVPEPAEAAAESPKGALSLPEPLAQATAVAVAAVQDWWKLLEPLLRKLQLQAIETWEASAAPLLKQLQADLAPKIAPHTDKAKALFLEWKEKLEPHATQVLEAVKAAKEHVRTQAYEPALVAIAAASEAVQRHAVAAAALVSTHGTAALEASQAWLEAQRPLLAQAKAAAMEHAQAALLALSAWRKQIEPLMANLAAASAGLVDDSKRLGLVIVEHSQEAAKQLEPHTKKALEWSERTGAEVMTKMEPVLAPVKQISEQIGKSVEPVLAPVRPG